MTWSTPTARRSPTSGTWPPRGRSPASFPRRPTIPARNCSTKPESVWASGRNRRSSCSRRRIRSRPTTVIHPTPHPDCDRTARYLDRRGGPLPAGGRRRGNRRAHRRLRRPDIAIRVRRTPTQEDRIHSRVRSASLVEERPEQRVPRPKDGAEQQQSVKTPQWWKERDRCPR